MNKDLIEQYKIVHSKQSGYGNNFGKGRYFDEMVEFLKSNNCNSVLDFGCGKGSLRRKLWEEGFVCDGYDPAVEVFSSFPSQNYDAVVSTDVFEHLDEENISDEFDLIKSVKPKFLYFNVATGKAGQILPCGINAHTIVKEPEWWENIILESFQNFDLCEQFFQSSVGAASVTFALKKK